MASESNNCAPGITRRIDVGAFLRPHWAITNNVVDENEPVSTANAWIYLRISQIAGAYAFVGGVLGIVGWAADLHRLIDWDGSGISMKANTAVAASAAGAALILAPYRAAHRYVQVLGAFVAAVGTLTLFQHVSGLSLGIDTLLFDEPAGAPATASPGRMGPPASISFALSGVALLLRSQGESARRTAVALALLVLAIATLALTGYLYGAVSMYTLPRITGIAMQTATMIAALGIGLVASLPEHDPALALREDSTAGVLARRLLPLVIFLPLIIGWLRLAGERAGLYDTAFGAAMRTVLEAILLASMLFWGVTAIRARERARALVADRLRESQKQLAHTLESITDALVTFDRHWCFTYVNTEAERLLGRSRQELLGHVVWDLFPELIGTSVDRDLRRVASERITLEVESINPRTERVFLNRVYPGPEDGVAMYFHDITQRKRAEDVLREADRRKDQFLATLAHELRNPLAPIRNASRVILVKGAEDPQLKWGAEVISRQVQYMSRLLDDLLDVSRISRNRLDLRKEWVDLAQLIVNAVETSRPAIDAHRHALSVSPPAEQVLIDADAVRVTQVIANLLNNAAKYTPDGGRIELRAERQGNEAVISVKDNGIGIPAASQKDVFEIFWQDPAAAVHSPGGLGIGLSLAKGLVELHGGRIEVRSDGEGSGSEFIVVLPAVCETTPAVPDPPAPSFVAGKVRRVLVVDDIKDNADSLARVLEGMGHEVRVAYGGADALEIAASMKPTVVLLDIGMPPPDGMEVCRKIRQKPWGTAILIGALTGWGQENDRKRTREAGFDLHFTKPVDIEVLGHALESGSPPPASL